MRFSFASINAYHGLTERVVKSERQILATVSRCLRLRCPVCGAQAIMQAPFKIRHHCTRCYALFQREEGFFVGAITINVVTTELFIIALYFICLLVLSSSSQMMLVILFAMALLFPVAFYHHSWSIWLGLDHLVEKLPRYRDANKKASEDVPGKSEG